MGQQDTASKILSKGWLQLMAEKTFKSKSSKVQGRDGGSTLDWILANKPDNVKQTKAEWTGTGADHAIVWAVKEMKESFRKKQMTRKTDMEEVQNGGTGGGSEQIGLGGNGRAHNQGIFDAVSC